ncbi:hypothetical protein GQ42DRAFT_9520 [Ramicandelaber brevisporus]|nr:hypothetical protein GQ42DRAFT_9520 [Ramicandelaber brevisporus]
MAKSASISTLKATSRAEQTSSKPTSKLPANIVKNVTAITLQPNSPVVSFSYEVGNSKKRTSAQMNDDDVGNSDVYDDNDIRDEDDGNNDNDNDEDDYLPMNGDYPRYRMNRRTRQNTLGMEAIPGRFATIHEQNQLKSEDLDLMRAPTLDVCLDIIRPIMAEPSKKSASSIPYFSDNTYLAACKGTSALVNYALGEFRTTFGNYAPKNTKQLVYLWHFLTFHLHNECNKLYHTRLPRIREPECVSVEDWHKGKADLGDIDIHKLPQLLVGDFGITSTAVLVAARSPFLFINDAFLQIGFSASGGCFTQTYDPLLPSAVGEFLQSYKVCQIKGDWWQSVRMKFVDDVVDDIARLADQKFMEALRLELRKNRDLFDIMCNNVHTDQSNACNYVELMRLSIANKSCLASMLAATVNVSKRSAATFPVHDQLREFATVLAEVADPTKKQHFTFTVVEDKRVLGKPMSDSRNTLEYNPILDTFNYLDTSVRRFTLTGIDTDDNISVNQVEIFAEQLNADAANQLRLIAMERNAFARLFCGCSTIKWYSRTLAQRSSKALGNVITSNYGTGQKALCKGVAFGQHILPYLLRIVPVFETYEHFTSQRCAVHQCHATTPPNRSVARVLYKCDGYAKIKSVSVINFLNQQQGKLACLLAKHEGDRDEWAALNIVRRALDHINCVYLQQHNCFVNPYDSPMRLYSYRMGNVENQSGYAAFRAHHTGKGDKVNDKSFNRLKQAQIDSALKVLTEEIEQRAQKLSATSDGIDKLCNDLANWVLGAGDNKIRDIRDVMASVKLLYETKRDKPRKRDDLDVLRKELAKFSN